MRKRWIQFHFTSQHCIFPAANERASIWDFSSFLTSNGWIMVMLLSLDFPLSGCLDGWWILCTTPFPLCTYILGMETLTQLLSSDSEYDYEHDVNVRFYRYFFHLFRYLPLNAKLCMQHSSKTPNSSRHPYFGCGNSSSSFRRTSTFMLSSSCTSSFAAYGIVILVTPRVLLHVWHHP